MKNNTKVPVTQNIWSDLVRPPLSPQLNEPSNHYSASMTPHQDPLNTSKCHIINSVCLLISGYIKIIQGGPFCHHPTNCRSSPRSDIRYPISPQRLTRGLNTCLGSVGWKWQRLSRGMAWKLKNTVMSSCLWQKSLRRTASDNGKRSVWFTLWESL